MYATASSSVACVKAASSSALACCRRFDKSTIVQRVTLPRHVKMSAGICAVTMPTCSFSAFTYVCLLPEIEAGRKECAFALRVLRFSVDIDADTATGECNFRYSDFAAMITPHKLLLDGLSFCKPRSPIYYCTLINSNAITKTSIFLPPEYARRKAYAGDK